MTKKQAKFRHVSKKPEPNNDDGMLMAEIASGHPTGGSHIPSDDKTTDFEVRSVLMNLWGIHEDLHPLATGSTARVWRTTNAIVKLARDEINHFNAGLRASQAVEASGLEAGTGDWYRESQPRQQLIRGDGPELLVNDGAVSGMVDWGGVRFGSVVDDIGCWTLHGTTKSIRDYTREFVRGYTSVSTLTPQEELAIPLFQQLRLASRACGVTDPTKLEAIERWMLNIR